MSNNSVINYQRHKNETEGEQRNISCRGKVIVNGERSHNVSNFSFQCPLKEKGNKKYQQIYSVS